LKKVLVVFFILLLGLIIQIFYLTSKQKNNLNQEFISKIALCNFAINSKYFYVRFFQLSSYFDKNSIDYSLPQRDKLSFIRR